MIRLKKKITPVIVSFSLLLLAFMFSSCSGNNSSYLEEIQEDGYGKALEPGDPNLDPDWDWYSPPSEENNYQKYSLWSRSGNDSGGDVVPHENVQLPYFDQDGGPAGTFFMGTQDYMPEDGWVLLCKNFGELDPPRQPFYMLYNKAQGVIRVFFYYTGNETSYVKIILRSVVASPDAVSERTSLFTFNKDKYACFNDYYTTDTKKNIWNGIVTYAEVMPCKWSHADFLLGYDPIQRKDIALEFKFAQIEVNDVELAGKADYKEVTHSERVNKDLWDILGAAVTAGGTIVSSGQKVYDKWQQDQKTKDDNSNLPGINIGLININNSDNGDDKSFTVRKKTKVAVMATVAAAIAIAGAVKKFVDAMKPTYSHYTDVWYDIDLSGTIKKETPYDHISMNLPGSIRGPRNLAPYKPLYDKPLGVFILEKKPKIAFRKLNYEERNYTNDDGDSVEEETWEYGFGLVEPLELSVNTPPGFKVLSRKASFVWEDRSTNRKINGSRGLTNYAPISNMFIKNCYSDDSIVNINTVFLDGDKFYKRETLIRSGKHTVLKKENFSFDDSSLAEIRKPLIQVKVELERENKIEGENNIVTLLKTYNPEYLDTPPESQSPATMMEIKQDEQFIYPNRVYQPFKVNLIPSEYGVPKPHRLTYTIKNYSTTDTLELSHDPKIIKKTTTPECFTIVTQPDASIAPGESTTFTLEFFSDIQGQYSAIFSIPSNDNGVTPYKFSVIGEVIADHSGFQAMAPTNFTANISSSSVIYLNWEDNSTVESGYKIYRKVEGEDQFKLIKSLGPDTTTYVDKELDYLGEKRWYWVTVYNQEGETFPKMSYLPIGFDSTWDNAVFADKSTSSSSDAFFH